jgi:FkbM family methyltransferase
MKMFLAYLFKLFFKVPFLRGTFFGLHQKIFKPLNLFNGLSSIQKHQNIKIKLNINDWIQQNIFFLGSYEEAELKVLANHLKPDNVFIDIGANFGLYSLIASQYISEEGSIFCFEPFPENYKSLCTNLSLNHLTRVTAENKAVGSEMGELKLYNNSKENNLGMVSSKKTKDSDVVTVTKVSLDDYLQTKSLEKITFIKIDVEGFEYEVLQGMKKTLQRYDPIILIEVLDSKSENDLINNPHELLCELGYKRFFIDDNGNLSSDPCNKGRKNYVYKRN